MNKMELRNATDEKREQVTIELWMNDKALGHIHLDAGSLEKYIHDLSKHRSTLIDEVSRTLDPGARLETLIDPAWRTSTEHSLEKTGIALILRHPGLGWLSFLLPHKEAADLGRWLTDHAGPPSSDASTPSESS